MAEDTQTKQVVTPVTPVAPALPLQRRESKLAKARRELHELRKEHEDFKRQKRHYKYTQTQKLSHSYVKHYYQDMHAMPGKQFGGGRAYKHKDDIAELVHEHGVKTMLDYGCGGGALYRKGVHLDWNLTEEPFLYDLGIPGQDVFPTGKQFDMIICCDVLEHVFPEDVPTVLSEILDHATKVVFLSISLLPASKSFPNGKNVHICLKPETWWKEQIQKANKKGLPVRIFWNDRMFKPIGYFEEL